MNPKQSAEAEDGAMPMMDPAFRDALKDKSTDWALRAVAGYTMRQFAKDPETREIANNHGLARALTSEEREAWTFGFTWVERTN